MLWTAGLLCSQGKAAPPRAGPRPASLPGLPRRLFVRKTLPDLQLRACGQPRSSESPGEAAFPGPWACQPAVRSGTANAPAGHGCGRPCRQGWWKAKRDSEASGGASSDRRALHSSAPEDLFWDRCHSALRLISFQRGGPPPGPRPSPPRPCPRAPPPARPPGCQASSLPWVSCNP